MRIALQTYGTTGDVRPFIALGAALVRNGHTVTLAATCIDGLNYSKLCDSLNIRFIPVPSNIRIAPSDLSHIGVATNPIKSIVETLKASMFPFIDEIHATARHLCTVNDLIISHFGLFPCRAAALEFGIPQFSMTFWPGYIVNFDERSANFPACNIISNVIDSMIKPYLEIIWKRSGLEFKGTALKDGLFSEKLNLIAASPLLIDPPPIHDSIHKMCGFLPLRELLGTYEIPDALKRFLLDGEPPVFMSFGSLHRINPDKCSKLLMETARLTKQKIIIQSPFQHEINSSEMCHIGFYPHHEILPYCKAIITHGGAGTVYSALSSALPIVTVVFNEEQFGWGTSVYKNGLGAPPLRFRNVLPCDIVKELERVISDTACKERLVNISKKLTEENGANQAVNLIEGFFNK